MRLVWATVETPFSRKYWSAAAASWRALLRTALSCEEVRTFWKAGIAIAARRPMMTTTIMISTRGKPLEVLRLFMGISDTLMMYDNRSGVSSDSEQMALRISFQD